MILAETLDFVITQIDCTIFTNIPILSLFLEVVYPVVVTRDFALCAKLLITPSLLIKSVA